MSERAYPNWPEVELGDICEFAYGKSLTADTRTGSGFPVFGSNGQVGFHEKALTESETIIIGRKGSFGEIHYSSNPCFPIDTTYYITKKQTKVHLPWLARRLRCLGLEKLNRAAAIPGLNRADAYRQKLLLPPLDEQKRIAEILDAADALRAKRREALAQLDALLQSTFLDMFGDPVTNPKGWKIGRLADVVKRLDGGQNVAQSETETQYRILKVSAVTLGQYHPEESKYLPEDFFVPESYLVKKGDLLISRANTTELVGTTAYVWQTPQNIVLPDKIWKFIWKECAVVEPIFIYHLSQNPKFRRVIENLATGTSGSMKNITKSKLLSIPIPLPPLSLQRRFAAIVEGVERQKARMRAHGAELDALFASLQSRAFNGEL